jgi:hypothetical protein
VSELFSDLSEDPLPRMQADIFANKRFSNESKIAFDHFNNPIYYSTMSSRITITGAQQAGNQLKSNVDYSFVQRLSGRQP